jgi:hypothetical protein
MIRYVQIITVSDCIYIYVLSVYRVQDIYKDTLNLHMIWYPSDDLNPAPIIHSSYHKIKFLQQIGVL